jgi:hypothetical protein
MPTGPYMGASGMGLSAPRGPGGQSVAGVTRLMQQCSSMLRERMYMGAGNAGQMGGVRSSYGSQASFDPQEVCAVGPGTQQS